MSRQKFTLEERFWDKVDIPADNYFRAWHMRDNPGCWIWTDRPNRYGYGQLNVGGKPLLAHRLSWSFRFGPIPGGACVLHKCDVRLCVRPDHLWLGTRVENQADMKTKGRAYRGGAKNPPRGDDHPMRKNPDLAASVMAKVRAAKAARRAARLQELGYSVSSAPEVEYSGTNSPAAGR